MKKLVSWLLITAMLLAMLPMAIFATQEPTQPGEDPTGINAEAAEAVLGTVGAKESGAQTFDKKQEEIAPETEVTIIVLLDEKEIPQSGTPTRAAQSRMLKQQKTVQKEISSKVLGGEAVKVEHSYCTLTNGFSTTVTYGQLEEIRKLDGVEAAFVAPSFELDPLMTTSNQMVGGGVYNTTGYNGEGMVIAILDTGVAHTHEVFAAAPENPRITLADVQRVLDENDLHCESDVPSIGASTLYYSAKIPFQFDYGDHDADGTPEETGGEHGTHVAATAAANAGAKEGFSGVAPQAQILNMKVFKKSGGASYDDILAALEDCMAIGVDAVNMSLGSACGFIDYEGQDEWTMNLIGVFNRAGESGMSLAVAVGNDYSGSYHNNYNGRALASNPDYGNASEPATYDESLAIAAVENAGMVSPYITVNGKNIAYYDGFDSQTEEVTKAYALRTLANRGSLEYVVIDGYGTAEDFEGLDLSGKIALLQRGGGLTYEAKANNAVAANAIGMLVYNNTPGMVYMSIVDWKIPIGFISQQDGAYLLKQQDKHLTIAVSDALVTSPVAGMCDFSSWGATSELTLKPELTAPGGNIYSAVPGNGYELMSGTSMASPHVAGGMAILRQALQTRYPTMTAGEMKDQIDTVLMSTAAIIYDGDTPVSPRKQGAGMMNINAAASSEGYITVDGMERPTMNLGDDVAKTGEYTLRFNVHNDGDSTLYYTAKPIVLTDGTQEQDGAVTMTEIDVPLAHTFAVKVDGVEAANAIVAVQAHSTVVVEMTVTLTNPEQALAAFTNGAFVEGWATLNAANADGSENENGIDLNAPFLAFYGDWTQAPLIDSGFWWDVIAHEETDAQTYANEALLSSMEKTYTTYLGDNNYDFTIPYLAARNAISPNNDDFLDSLSYVYTGMLRSARTFTYTITGEDGTLYYEKTIDYELKSVYDDNYYSIVPAGAISDYGDCIDPWYGTDKLGFALPNGTKATVKVTATPIYDAHESNNLRDSWSFPITIDTEAPEVLNMEVRESEGRYYATITVRDNEYAAAVVLTDSKYSKEYVVKGIGETEAGQTTVIEDIDITGCGETIGLVVHDYAGNSKSFYLRAPGNTDDYADVVVTEDMVLYSEDFNAAWLPANWSVQSKTGATETWYRDEYNMAAIDPDELVHQNEWLFTPSYDLSGQTTPTHMIFDFETSYTFCVQYPHFNVDVYSSKDDGETWSSIWNLRDSGLYSDWTRTQAKVVIPDAYQGQTAVRFAFVYTGDTGGAQFAMDNLRIYRDRAEDYVAVTATAGANGSISPSGKTLVRKGTSKTFTATPNEGFEVAELRVDGVSYGAISYYTLEKVGIDHTIEVTFKATEPKTGYTVTAAATEGGTITPSGAVTVAAGASQTFAIAPSYGYRTVSVRVNGKSVGKPESYTLDAVEQNYYILATFEEIPETPEVLFEQDFEGAQFPPAGWDVRGIAGGADTWKSHSYYYLNKTKQAYVYAGTGAQDERLVAPTVNLKNAKTTALEFDYAYPHYGMKNGDFTFTLEASADNGATWETIWNAADTLPASLSGYVVTDRAFLSVPAKFCIDGVVFAWRFTRPAGENTGIAAIDNVKLKATGVSTDIEGYAKITATAGEGGAITPAGRVYVKEGESQTFTITPIAGYAIKDVLVDGMSVGAVGSYVFEDITGEHTIAASFEVSSDIPGVLFENDFEDEAFPSRGWSVKSDGASSKTWKQDHFSNLNTTKVAVVVNDYEDWSNAPKQDELLITPTVDLSETTTPTLKFDYVFGRADIFRDVISLTLEASTDNGETWSPIWDASNLENLTGWYQSGSAEVVIPVLYRTAAVKFAFRYVKPNGNEGDKVGIDNVQLCEPTEECTHPTTELRNVVAATCTTDGYTGDTYCTVCTRLVKAGAVIIAKGHTKVATAAKDATCTEAGNTAYWYCSACEKYFSDEACTAETTLAATVIAAKGHTKVATAAKDATCTEAGNTAYWYCSACEKYFSDEACTAETTLAATVIAAKGHTKVATAAKDATCTEAGNIAYWRCSVCQKYFSDEACTAETTLANTAIAALGHTVVLDAAKAATCTETGLSEGNHCSVCKEVLVAQTETAALGHAWDEGKVTTEPTATEKGVKIYTCTRCDAIKTEEIPETGEVKLPFTDVPEGKWFTDAVKFAYANNLFGGTSETTFTPDGNMTRGMLVTVLWRLDGKPAPKGGNAFNDVAAGKYYTDAVTWAAENKVVGGVGNGKFNPDGNVTREQIAAIMFRYAKFKSYDTSKTADLSKFPDSGKVSAYAKEPLSWANAEQLIAGTSQNGATLLDPQGNATRAQVATILMRYVQNIVNAE